MEDIEQDDTQEIFQECDNFVTKSLISEHHQQEKNKDFPNFNQTNNNHHVVHVGVFIVLLTTYLGVTSVHKCLVNCVENASIAEQVQQHREEISNYLQQTEKLENTKILQRFLEYKDICKDLEIFTKQQEKEKSEAENAEENINGMLLDTDTVSGGIEENSSGEYDDSSGSSGNDGCGKENQSKHKKSKYSIKTSSTKNGFNKYNKSTKAKNQKNPKKDLNLNKKTSTAEPIIYLFALVFIYLLLKAASDINQHYKSQNKNDKRLRRCSLQSYAQTHRPDRRASKELALKQKQLQRLKSLSRSSSQEQQHYNQHQQQHFIDGSPQKLSELKQKSTTGTPILSKVSHSNNWQLLRQHTTTQSLDNSDILHNARGNAELCTSRMARRCSVPAALSHQRQTLLTASPLSSANDHIKFNVSSSRRTSIVSSPLSLTMDPNDSLMPEAKRRVRMINRH